MPKRCSTSRAPTTCWGFESEADDAYQAVRALGLHRLSAEDRPRWYVQAGSTLRLLGRLSESRAVLLEGVARFPDYLAIRAFLAVTELAAERPQSAAASLFDALMRVAEPSLRFYERALNVYRHEI
jgi:thioredoxin-like negative regulator of GroEL